MSGRAAWLLLTVPAIISMVGCESKEDKEKRLAREEKIAKRLDAMGKTGNIGVLQKLVNDDAEDKTIRKAAKKQIETVNKLIDQDPWLKQFRGKTLRLLEIMNECPTPNPWLGFRRRVYYDNGYFSGSKGAAENNITVSFADPAKNDRSKKTYRWSEEYLTEPDEQLNEYFFRHATNPNETVRKSALDKYKQSCVTRYTNYSTSAQYAISFTDKALTSKKFKPFNPNDYTGNPTYTEEELVAQFEAYLSNYNKIHTFLEEVMLPAIKE